jgi:hypothetical protein
MCLRRYASAKVLALLAIGLIGLAGCGGAGQPISSLPSAVSGSAAATASTRATSSLATAAPTSSPNPVATSRPGFLGAFFRPEGPPPYGIFAAQSTAPAPYPTPGPVIVGINSYCDQVARNGASIDSSYTVDTTKLNDVIYLNARWTRMPAPQFFVDVSHVFGAGTYFWQSFDAAQCVSLGYHYLRPVIGLEAGPVQYNATPGKVTPTSYPTYQTATDFGTWCGAVAAHERAAFPSVYQFSLPGNEVNSNPQLFPGGEAQIAAYSKACYAAIKAAYPTSYVYGFELNTELSLNPAGFVSRLNALGCGVGTCYDGISMHFSLRYPIPSASTPCYPNPGGQYSMQCITDIETAAGAPIHVLISETVYTVPGSVPDEQTKAEAIVAEAAAFAANPMIDGMLYSDVDECAEYPSGFFMNGCLITTSRSYSPAWYSLQWYAYQHFL